MAELPASKFSMRSDGKRPPRLINPGFGPATPNLRRTSDCAGRGALTVRRAARGIFRERKFDRLRLDCQQ